MSPLLYLIVKKCIAVLKCPRKIGDFIFYARAIHDAMKADAQFAASLPTLALLDTAIQDLEKAQSGCQQKPPTYTTEERDAAKVVVKDFLETLRMDVQKVADADKPNAEAIILAASMHVKVISIREKRKNSAENGTEPHSVFLTAEGEGAHEWRQSQDNNVWIPLPATLVGTTTVYNLIEREKYYFQNRRILTKGRYTEWSQSVDINVK
jgi:hypothetical protein